MKRFKLNLSIRPAIVIIIVLAALFLLARFIGQVFMNSVYFKIKEIKVSQSNVMDLSYLEGQNIFGIDLKRESRYISELHPHYRQIRMVRILPDCLYVHFIARKPVALVKLYRYFYVDDEFALFDAPVQIEANDIPLILGLETKIFGPRPGTRYNIKELRLALDIINQVKRNRILKGHRIRRIDMINPASASIFLVVPPKTQESSGTKFIAGESLLEAKLGEDNIRDRIEILAGLFAQVKNDIYNIKYIDVRFKEPVIKLRNAK
jgi:cell division septal protein FtsQ